MDTLTTLMWTNVAAATGLTLFALFAGPLLRRAELTHKVWLVVLLKLIAPSLLVLPILPVIERRPSVADPVQPQVTPDSIKFDDPANITTLNPIEPLTSPDVIETVRPDQRPFEAAMPPEPGIGYRGILLQIWLGGAIAYWLMVLFAVVRLNCGIRSTTSADDATELARRVARRLGLRRFPRVEFAQLQLSPLVFAASWRPRLIMPRVLWDRLTEPQRETMLAHEFAHVARRDHWVRRLEVFVLGCYWWCPLAWFARTRLQRAEEVCCDHRVLSAYPESAQAYAEALIETAMFVARPSCVPLASGGSATVTELKRRVAMILTNRPIRAIRRPVTAAMLAIGIALLALRPGYSQVAPSADPLAPQATPQPSTPADPARPATGTPLPTYTPAITQLAPVAQSAHAATTLGTALQATAGNYSPQSQQNLRDEIEALEAQRTTKQAQLQVAKAVVMAADRKLDLMKSTASSKIEINQVEDERNIAQARLMVQEAELQEHEVKIKQAKRKLQPAATSTQNIRLHDKLTSQPTIAVPTITTPAPAIVLDAIHGTAPAKARGAVSLDGVQAQLDKIAADQKALQAQLKKAQDEYQQLRNQSESLDKQRRDLERYISDWRNRATDKPPDPKE